MCFIIKTTVQANCASTLHEGSRCNTGIQIALGIIAASGVVIAVCAYFSYLPPLAGYCGIGGTVASLIALGVFRSRSSSALDRRIDACQSFNDLLGITDEAKEVTISRFRTRYLSIEGYGKSTVEHLAERTEKLIASHRIGQTFEYPDGAEHEKGKTVVGRIWHYFFDNAKTIKRGNCFTHFCYSFPKFLKDCICYMDIERRWLSNEYGIQGTIRGVYAKKSDEKVYRKNMSPHWDWSCCNSAWMEENYGFNTKE